MKKLVHMSHFVPAFLHPKNEIFSVFFLNIVFLSFVFSVFICHKSKKNQRKKNVKRPTVQIMFNSCTNCVQTMSNWSWFGHFDQVSIRPFSHLFFFFNKTWHCHKNKANFPCFCNLKKVQVKMQFQKKFCFCSKVEPRRLRCFQTR